MSVWTRLQKIFKFVIGLTVKASREFDFFFVSLEKRFFVEETEDKEQYTICLNHVVNLSIISN